jgi:hypothetical protein
VSRPGRRWGRGGLWTTAVAVARAEPAAKGGSPSTAKYSSAPSAHRSAGGPTAPALACSGAMYDGEPTTMPGMVSPDSSRRAAIPKSASLTGAPTSTLAGFTSRWTMPWA